MNLRGTRIVELFPWLRHLKYLLLVPILMVAAYGSYRYGQQSVSLEKNTAGQLERESRSNADNPTPGTPLQPAFSEDIWLEQTTANRPGGSPTTEIHGHTKPQKKNLLQNPRPTLNSAFSSTDSNEKVSLKGTSNTLNHESILPANTPPANQNVNAIRPADRIYSSGGATYVRWGRNVCSSESELVYKGVAAGSLYDSTGGGSNYLCLPMDPLWGIYNDAVEKGSKIYGAEYEVPSTLTLDNVGGRPLQDNNVPCAVCLSLGKNSIIMIPARNQCYDGWKLEYVGSLMSGHNEHSARTQFVCMDGSPEADLAGYRDENGALFYQVEGVCGSLPCPPYIPRREITCVVCGK